MVKGGKILGMVHPIVALFKSNIDMTVSFRILFVYVQNKKDRYIHEVAYRLERFES
jgi:hypothetical protein